MVLRQRSFRFRMHCMRESYLQRKIWRRSSKDWIYFWASSGAIASVLASCSGTGVYIRKNPAEKYQKSQIWVFFKWIIFCMEKKRQNGLEISIKQRKWVFYTEEILYKYFFRGRNLFWKSRRNRLCTAVCKWLTEPQIEAEKSSIIWETTN